MLYALYYVEFCNVLKPIVTIATQSVDTMYGRHTDISILYKIARIQRRVRAYGVSGVVLYPQSVPVLLELPIRVRNRQSHDFVIICFILFLKINKNNLQVDWYRSVKDSSTSKRF